MVLVHVVNWFLPIDLRFFGIYPRHLPSLPFVFTAPFLHASWGHLASNVIGFVLFSALCMLHGRKRYIQVSLTIVGVGGLLVWIFARQNVHIGASGWVFGLWAYSIAIAWFDRSFFNIVIAIAVAIFYGGMVFGVLPSNPYVSFESHLFGALAGVLAAGMFGRKKG